MFGRLRLEWRLRENRGIDWGGGIGVNLVSLVKPSAHFFLFPDLERNRNSTLP